MKIGTTNAGSLRAGDTLGSGAVVLDADADGTRVALALRFPCGRITASVVPVTATIGIRAAS